MIGMLQLNNLKYDITCEIRNIVEPKMWESGFVSNFHERMMAPHDEKPDTVYTRIYHFGDDDDGEAVAHVDEFSGITIEGFTPEGIITDTYGGGMCVKPYDECMLEQLMFALKIAKTVE